MFLCACFVLQQCWLLSPWCKSRCRRCLAACKPPFWASWLFQFLGWRGKRGGEAMQYVLVLGNHWYSEYRLVGGAATLAIALRVRRSGIENKPKSEKEKQMEETYKIAHGQKWGKRDLGHFPSLWPCQGHVFSPFLAMGNSLYFGHFFPFSDFSPLSIRYQAAWVATITQVCIIHWPATSLWCFSLRPSCVPQSVMVIGKGSHCNLACSKQRRSFQQSQAAIDLETRKFFFADSLGVLRTRCASQRISSCRAHSKRVWILRKATCKAGAGVTTALSLTTAKIQVRSRMAVRANPDVQTLPSASLLLSRSGQPAAPQWWPPWPLWARQSRLPTQWLWPLGRRRLSASVLVHASMHLPSPTPRSRAIVCRSWRYLTAPKAPLPASIPGTTRRKSGVSVDLRMWGARASTSGPSKAISQTYASSSSSRRCL